MSESRDCPGATVVITCFNQAHFLSNAIESALSQTHGDFEVIVIDDGSTDNTAVVAAKYPNVRYVKQANGGSAAARNAGIREASRSHIVFLDGDDRLLPRALEINIAVLEENPDSAFVYGAYRLIARDGSPQQSNIPAYPPRDGYAELLRGNYIAMHGTVMYRRAIFDEVGLFNSELKACEDYEMFLRIARLHSFCGHNEIIAEYREHEENISRDFGRMLTSALTVLEMQREYVQERPEYEKAFAEGKKFWKQYYGSRLAARIKRESAAQAVQDALTLFRYAPVGLPKYVAQYCFRKLRAFTMGT